MEVEKLFRGIGIIIDDEINDNGSTIKNIKDFLSDCDIPILTFDQLPNINMISSFSAASFIILDWDYFHENIIQTEEAEEFAILKPDTLSSDVEQQLIDFIKELLNSVFVPIFLFHQSLWTQYKKNYRMKSYGLRISRTDYLSKAKMMLVQKKNCLVQLKHG